MMANFKKLSSIINLNKNKFKKYSDFYDFITRVNKSNRLFEKPSIMENDFLEVLAEIIYPDKVEIHTEIWVGDYYPEQVENYKNLVKIFDKIDIETIICELYINGMIDFYVDVTIIAEEELKLYESIKNDLIMTAEEHGNENDDIYEAIIALEYVFKFVIGKEKTGITYTDKGLSLYSKDFINSIRRFNAEVTDTNIVLSDFREDYRESKEKLDSFYKNLITIMALLVSAFAIIGVNISAIGNIPPGMDIILYTKSVIVMNMSLVFVLAFVFWMLDIIVFKSMKEKSHTVITMGMLMGLVAILGYFAI